MAQVAGALCASLIGHYITGSGFAPRPGAEVGTGPALLVEILYTFALALVVLNVATSKKTEGNSFYGLAIGFTIAAAAFAGGGISGGAYNPAVGTGPIIIDAILTEGAGFSNLWLYIVGPFVGGAAAAFVFKFQEGNGGGGES